MKEHSHVFFELLEHDVEYHTNDLAKRARSALPSEVLASMTPGQHKALIASMREGVEFIISSFLGHCDNVGCHLPPEVLGFSILARLPGTSEQPDIREGAADYVDMWGSFRLDRHQRARDKSES